MINLNNILREIDDDIQRELNLRVSHRKRVVEAANWFNSLCLSTDPEIFYGNHITYLDQKCLCVNANLYYPSAYFTLRPIDGNADIGAGVGNMVDIKF